MTAKIGKAVIVLFFILSAAVYILNKSYIYNLTESFPVGLYEKVEASFEKWELVSFCPPMNEAMATAYERGYIKGGICDGNYGYMIKKIVAVHGDTISITNKGVFVNGKLIENTIPLHEDGDKLPLKPYTLGIVDLEKDEFFVVSDYNEYSFDSRYLGPIKKASINSALREVGK